ncbi:MAG: DUF262 domain-containing HNH endonuclease family protein, partial [Actinomycetota bacterium]
FACGGMLIGEWGLIHALEGTLKADTLTLTQLFNKPVSYVVPLFQRPYVWKKVEHWEPLWNDIRNVAERLLAERQRAAAGDTDVGLAEQQTPAHFLGAVVLEQMMFGAGMIERRHVIDGQQRLTTLQLLLDAAHDVAAELGDPTEKLFAKLTDNDPDLVQQLSDNYKVWPTNFDEAAFRATMSKDAGAPERSEASSSQMWRAHDYFCVAIRGWLDEEGASTPSDRLDALRTVMWQLLRIVVIDLEPGDNAQVIFETLNARGTPLLASDLIKNTIFQQAVAQHLDIEEMYEKHWRALDDEWWRVEVSQGRLFRPRLDLFFFHWLTMRRSSEFGAHDLFPEFKRYAATNEGGPREILEDVGHFTRTYRAFEEYPAGTTEELFFYRLGATETTTVMPLLLYIFGADETLIERAQRLRLIAAIESWLIRRMVCRLTTKNYNVVFMNLLQRVQAEPPRAGDIGVEFFRTQQGESQLWPTDDEVLTAIRMLPLYKVLSRGRLRVVLEAIEDSLRPPHVEQAHAPRNLTIEHVLPQSWDQHWPLVLPPDEVELEARTRRNTLLHSLGNLTLVTKKLNPKLSNDAWVKKRVTLQDHTVLFLNKDVLNDQELWDEDVIVARGERLGAMVVQLWPGPESETWGSVFDVTRTALETPDDLGDLDNLASDEGEVDADLQTWSHDAIRAYLRNESLRDAVDEFEEWASAAGLRVRHSRRSNHLLLAGERRIGSYYFAQKWIHFSFRGRASEDAALSDALGAADYRVHPGYASLNVTAPAAFDVVKSSYLARAAAAL